MEGQFTPLPHRPVKPPISKRGGEAALPSAGVSLGVEARRRKGGVCTLCLHSEQVVQQRGLRLQDTGPHGHGGQRTSTRVRARGRFGGDSCSEKTAQGDGVWWSGGVGVARGAGVDTAAGGLPVGPPFRWGDRPQATSSHCN